jgi:hypothetical protein
MFEKTIKGSVGGTKLELVWDGGSGSRVSKMPHEDVSIKSTMVAGSDQDIF